MIYDFTVSVLGLILFLNPLNLSNCTKSSNDCLN